MTIRDAIQQINKDAFKFDNCFVAEVKSVSGFECVVVYDSTELPGVRLQMDASNGVLYKPKVGSNVLVASISDFDFAVVMYSAIDEITFLDGSFGGLIKIEDLVTKLNNLEDKVNSIINTFNTHVHTGVTTGAGSSAVSPTPVTGTLTPTNKAEIENDKITHGTV